MKVYTIIVTYNAMKWIERCVTSLLNSTIQTSIVIIDNCSKDETVSFVKKTYPQTTVITQEKNLGFGQANNVGIRMALANGATHILLLNQDAWIDSKMLETLLPFDDGKTVLSPVHLNGAATAIDKNFLTNAIIRSGYDNLRIDDPLLTRAKGLHPAQEICAACWLIPRRIIEKIGGFNPLFFHYSEDVNYQYRLFYHHMRIAWAGGTHVCHDREFRKRQPATYIRVRQELVLRASNINVSPLKATLQEIRYGIGVLHTALAYREWRSIAYFWKAYFYMLTHMAKAINDSRNIEKKQGENWL